MPDLIRKYDGGSNLTSLKVHSAKRQRLKGRKNLNKAEICQGEPSNKHFEIYNVDVDTPSRLMSREEVSYFSALPA